MEQLKHFNITEKEKDVIINAAYGDSSLPEKIGIYIKMIFNPAVRNLYSEHRKIANASLGLKNSIKCPEELIGRAYASLNLHKEKRPFFENVYSLILTKPAYSLAAIILIISLMFIPDLINKTTPRKYSEQEVAEARRQAEATLAYVGIVLKKAEKTAVEETLYGRVGKPINESLNSINKLLGGRYETSN